MTTRANLQAALANQNVVAFLKAIRLGEGTSDEAGYYRIVGGGTFQDDGQHPNVRVWIERYGVYSTAAGAFQFERKTWAGLMREYGFEDFSPESQEEGAVALIAECHALEDVIAGRFADAVAKVSKEWASLPGSHAGQRTEKFAAVLAAYTEAGGTLA